MLRHVLAADNHTRIAGDDIVECGCLLQLRIGDPGLDRGLQPLLLQGHRQIGETQRIGRECPVGERGRALPGAVVEQRCRLGDAPGIGKCAVQLPSGDRRPADHRLEVGSNTFIRAEQTLHRTRSIGLRQGDRGVDIAAAQVDGEALAGIPLDHIAVGRIFRNRAVGQRQRVATVERIGLTIQPDRIGATQREGHPVAADAGRHFVDHADRGARRPLLGADLHIHAVAGERRFRQGEFANRLEVVIQPVERRDVDVAECRPDGVGRRRRQRHRHDGAGHGQGHIVLGRRVAGRVGVGRIQYHRLGVDADGARVQLDDRFGIGGAGGDVAERIEAGVQEAGEVADGEQTGQVVGWQGRAVLDAEIGEQRRTILRRGAEVQHVVRAATGQGAVATELLDQRLGRVAGSRLRIDDLGLRAGADDGLAAGGRDGHLKVGVRLRAERVGEHIDGDLCAGLAGGDLHRAGAGAADDAGQPEIGRARIGYAVLDRRVLWFRRRQVDGVGNRQRARCRFDRGGAVRDDAGIGRRWRVADPGAVQVDALLLHVGAGGDRVRVSGHQQIDDRRLDQVRIRDARGLHLRPCGSDDRRRQLADVQRVRRETCVSERRRGFAGRVVQQRGRIGDAPRVRIGAIQHGGRDRLRDDRAVRQLQIGGRVAVIGPEQALHAARVRRGQCNRIVDVRPAQRDGHRLAGVPVHPVLVAGDFGDRAAGQG